MTACFEQLFLAFRLCASEPLANLPTHPKLLKGFGRGVLEVVLDRRGDTVRAVRTVRLRGRVCVLPAFR
jgi:phage-related protein